MASFYPKPRLNQLITHCDSHHNNLGYSGTMGNAVHIVDNNFYDNTTGIATDSFYAGGHPGYPQNGGVYENNRIYSNNFNVYAPDSDVKSSVPVPIGVGMLIGGGNDDTLKGNHIYDNWRRGTMLMSVPDAISCAPNTSGTAPPCTPQGAGTTSNGNRYTGNVMSRSPDGTQMPNGVDFWWDEYAGNTGNCWPGNKGQDGTAATVTSDPPRAPGDATVPGYLPVKDCDSPEQRRHRRPAEGGRARRLRGGLPERQLRLDGVRLVRDAAEARRQGQGRAATRVPRTGLDRELSEPVHPRRGPRRDPHVQSVPAPIGLSRRGPLVALAAAGALALGIATTADAPTPAAHPYNGLIGGVQLQQARCIQWNAGTSDERDKVAAALSYSVGGASTSGGRGTTLNTSEAHSLFDRACSSQIAANWLLYELYIRAAAFRSYSPR